MSESGRGSFAIQWHYILFGPEDLNAILGNLKRLFDSLLDSTKRNRCHDIICQTLGVAKTRRVTSAEVQRTIIDWTIIKHCQTGFSDWAVTTLQVHKAWQEFFLSAAAGHPPDADAKERTK